MDIENFSTVSNVESFEGTNDVESQSSKNYFKSQIDSMIERGEGNKWFCKECGKNFNRKFTAENHCETHIKGYLHQCHYCNKEYSSRNSLSNHISLFHKNR